MELQHKQKYLGNFLSGIIKEVHSSTLNIQGFLLQAEKTSISIIPSEIGRNITNFSRPHRWLLKGTRLGRRVEKETMKWKGEGKEERRPSVRTAGERENLKLRQGSCAGCLQPSPRSPRRCRGRCDLRADGTSDESHAAAGVGQ